MIVSASRRTDIPAFYSEWFAQRLAAGWCEVPNPFNRRQLRRVSLRHEDVDAFYFWTRNPTPFLPVVETLERRGDPSVFLVTLTGYGPPLEPHAPPRAAAVRSILTLSRRIGPGRVVWRYDPLVLGPGLGVEQHSRSFADLASRLEGATEVVKISFLDLYRKTTRRLSRLPNGSHYLREPLAHPDSGRLLATLSALAREHGMRVETCAEEADLEAYGASHGSCVDRQLLRRLFGLDLPAVKDRGQRPACRCAPSWDIGMNDSCLHGCVYCYATRSHETARRRHLSHDPASPSLLPLD